MKLQFFLVFHYFTLLLPNHAHSQIPTQTIRGKVVDKISQSSIEGANIILLNSKPLLGTSSDQKGNFKLKFVPVGNQTLKVTYLGYKELTLPNIEVTSGKEVVLSIELEESLASQNEVVVTKKVEKNRAINESVVVSGRTFSVEETQKYAASIDDPARMVTAFPGVVATGGNGNNNISIRGNAPNGLLWRMEGADIPNPNHFSSVGTSGGGISILSSQLLTNSDFLTGAFPAEYGNALSGVFDLRLRKGNNETNEFTAKASFIGLDFAAEGPFAKGYEGSYLINYRYSTPTLIAKLGVNIGSGVIQYQDLSYNFYFPTKKLGIFTLFGFGGLSSQYQYAVKDSTKWISDYSTRFGSNFYSNTGATGVTHFISLDPNTYLKSSLVVSGTSNGETGNKLDNFYNTQLEDNESYIQTTVALSSTITKKINARNSFKVGIVASKLDFNFLQQSRNNSTNILFTALNQKGSAYTIQAFGQWTYRASDKLTVNAGLHYLELLLNNTYSIEPRASIKYDISSIQSIAFGYGIESQIQPVGTYFVQVQNLNGNLTQPNKDLGLSKSEQFVLSYDRSLTEFIHLKAEIYYQYLFNIPISTDPLNTFSIVNQQYGYPIMPLVNNGVGRNYGLELTFEQFLHNNTYYIISSSIYDSKYQASNGNWYNTLYNGNYTFSITGGKEFKTGDKLKNRILGVNIKLTYAGGLRETPYDTAASIANDYAVYQNNLAFSLKLPAYFRTDIGLSMKRNRERSTITWSIDIQNVTNTQNIFQVYFDPPTKTFKTSYQAGILPILSYKVDF